MKPCTTHHHACDCREHKVSVLIKAALDAASELDSLKSDAAQDPHAAPIAIHERDRLQSVVDRVYDACEQLGVVIGEPEVKQPCQHVICVADVCAKCGAEVPA